MSDRDPLPRRLDRRPFEAMLKIGLIVCLPAGVLTAVFAPWWVSLGLLVLSLFVICHRLISR